MPRCHKMKATTRVGPRSREHQHGEGLATQRSANDIEPRCFGEPSGKKHSPKSGHWTATRESARGVSVVWQYGIVWSQVRLPPQGKWRVERDACLSANTTWQAASGNFLPEAAELFAHTVQPARKSHQHQRKNTSCDTTNNFQHTCEMKDSTRHPTAERCKR